jgi:hypothetical protein
MPAHNNVTKQKEKARRLFFLLVGLVLAGAAVTAWAAISRDWVLVALACIAGVNLLSMAGQNSSVGWPGSRVGSYHRRLRIRPSKVQELVAGMALIGAAVAALALFSEGNIRALLAFAALAEGSWVARLLWTVFKERRGRSKQHAAGGGLG